MKYAASIQSFAIPCTRGNGLSSPERVARGEFFLQWCGARIARICSCLQRRASCRPGGCQCPRQSARQGRNLGYDPVVCHHAQPRVRNPPPASTPQKPRAEPACLPGPADATPTDGLAADLIAAQPHSRSPQAPASRPRSAPSTHPATDGAPWHPEQPPGQ